MGSDIKTVTQKVIQIIGHVNTMLTQLKLTVVISSIEIWSNKNKIPTTGHPDNLLFRFSDWNYMHLKPKSHQITYLFVFRKHPTYIGTTFPGRVCDKNYAVGVALNCTHKSCCNPSFCTLKKNAVCGSGECCSQDCKIKPLDVLCRRSADKECDFNEYCDGANSYCVPNTFARNGQTCDSGTGFCFSGMCVTFDRQCESLVGKGSKGAPFACYDEINSKTDIYGHCGGKYCNFVHLLCGKLVCTWPHRTLISRPNLSVIYAHVRDDICVSTNLPGTKFVKGSLDRDETFVKDGSMCGPDMYCWQYQCKEVRFLIDYKACHSATNCNGHGVCNNFNHCHCEKGFAPPDCEPQKEGFGSVDDGHKIKAR
uniref:Uncharacterized protein n=1 Tax=Prolemur simus TaxID=1328070 RepID=A0A8C8YPX7_PROSS